MNIKCLFGGHQYITTPKTVTHDILTCKRCDFYKEDINDETRSKIVHRHPICGHVEGSKSCGTCISI